jgi:16S rRNA (adenine1518-N6/adenine1519-N6)-dimethyltransferase
MSKDAPVIDTDRKFRAKKALGQNFLVDKAVLADIIAASELKPSDVVVEIGPGTGVLTFELAKYCKEVIAVEKDQKLAETLSQKSKVIINNCNSKLSIIVGDILDYPPHQLTTSNYKLVANIPYYITSKILRHFLEGDHKPELIVLMTQKEVAERICAKPRSTSSGQAGDMSLLSVSVQYFGKPEIVRYVAAESFRPKPEVDSAILRIASIKDKVESIQGVDAGFFFKIVRAGFAARRKTLLNNLKTGTEFSAEQILAIIKKMGLDEKVRAQELSMKQWGQLCREIAKIKK